MNADTSLCCTRCGTPLHETFSPISGAKYLLCTKCFAVYNASEMLHTAVRTPDPVRKPTLNDRDYAVRCPICGKMIDDYLRAGGRFDPTCRKCNQRSVQLFPLMEAAVQRRKDDYLRMIGKNPSAPVTLPFEFHQKGRSLRGTITLRSRDSHDEACLAIEKVLSNRVHIRGSLTITNWKKRSDLWYRGITLNVFACQMEGQTLLAEARADFLMPSLYGCPNARRTDDLPRRRQIEVIRYE